jgi:hypothetical protein
MRDFLACEDIACGSQHSGMVIIFLRNMEALPCVRRYSWWVPAISGRNFLRVIRRLFLACEDVAGASQLSGGGNIFSSIMRRHFLACQDVTAGSQLSGVEIFFA